MITKELIDYIKAQQATGASRSDIDKALIDNGWFQEDLNEAYSKLQKEQLSDVHPGFEPAAISSQPGNMSSIEKAMQPESKAVQGGAGDTFEAKEGNTVPRDDLASKLEESEEELHKLAGDAQDTSSDKKPENVFDVNHVEEVNHVHSGPGGAQSGQKPMESQKKPETAHPLASVRVGVSKKPQAELTQKKKEEPTSVKPKIDPASLSSFAKSTQSPVQPAFKQHPAEPKASPSVTPMQSPSVSSQIIPDGMATTQEQKGSADGKSLYNQALVEKMPTEAEAKKLKASLPAENTPKKRSTFGWLRTLGVIIGFLVISAAALVYAHARGTITLPFDLPEIPVFSLGGTSPEALLASTLENVGVDQQFSYSLNLHADLPGYPLPSIIGLPDIPDGEGVLNIVGQYDGSDATNPKLQFTFDAEPRDSLFGGEFRMVDKILYAQLNKIPGLSSFGFDGLESIWVKLALADVPTKLYFHYPLYERVESFIAEPKLLTKAKIDQIITTLRNGGIVTSVDFIEKDEINGRSMYEYAVSFNAEILNSTLQGELSQLISDWELKNINAKIETYLSGVNITSITLWIGEEDARIYRVLITGTNSFYQEEYNGRSAPFEITVELDEYGQAKDIASPIAEPLPFDAAKMVVNMIFGDATNAREAYIDPSGFVAGQGYVYDLGAFFQEQQDAFLEERITSDLFWIHRDMEDYATEVNNGSYLKGCVSSDFTMKLSDITQFYLPANPTCRDSDTSYIAFAKLPSGKFLCTDSTKAYGELDTTPQGFLCSDAGIVQYGE